MAKTYKTGELKEVGRVKISAKGLREIANKLEQKTGSDSVVNLMVYLTPGETPTDYPDLGYDFGTISTEAKKVEEAPKEVKPETPKAEEAPKPQETPKAEEAKPATPPAAETPKVEETPKAAETPAPKAETPAPTAEEVKAKELKDKAQEITTEANKSLSMEPPK